MKEIKRILLLAVLFIANIINAQVSSCPNSDFELANFSGWNGQTGKCCPISTSSSGILTGRHTIMSGIGTDPNTCNKVTVVAPGGLYSARLGNDRTGAEAEKLTYSLVVTPSNSLFIYKYAVVLQDPSHSVSEQPRFQIRVVNASGNLIDPICGQYTVVAASTIPGFQTCNGDIRYKDWTTVGLDLSSYIGQTITIEFATGDCSRGGHFGYAYVDAFCSPLQINSIYCSGSLDALLTAPIGFSYLWNTGATTQSITVNNPKAGLTYSCQLTSVTGCKVNISTILQLVDPVADFDITNTCYNNAIFSNTTPLINNSVLDKFHWDFGDGTTSAIENPSHSFPAPGDYIVTFTIFNAQGCTNTTSKLKTVYFEPTAKINYSGTTFCNSIFANQDVILTGTHEYKGGTFTAPPGLTINPSSGAITPNSSIPGDYLVTYTIPTTNKCTVMPVTTNVTITKTPSASIAYKTPFCINLNTEQSVNITGLGTYTGGTFSAKSGLKLDTTSGSITPSESTTGTHTVTYTTQTVGGCNISVTTNVKIEPLPNPEIVNGIICFDSEGNLINSYIFNTGLSSSANVFQWFLNSTLIQNETSNILVATSIGNYAVIATNLFTGCVSNLVSASVTSAQRANDFIVSVQDVFSNENVLTIIVQGGDGPFQYQIDDTPIETNNVYIGLKPGIHRVTVSSDNKCTYFTKEVIILGYPKFFTPNQDGYNEFWNINNFENQAIGQVSIYDRYGKFIKKISITEQGWDGTYNGRPLPATDYWFSVDYQEMNIHGQLEWKIFKSHFTLKR